MKHVLHPHIKLDASEGIFHFPLSFEYLKRDSLCLLRRHLVAIEASEDLSLGWESQKLVHCPFLHEFESIPSGN